MNDSSVVDHDDAGRGTSLHAWNHSHKLANVPATTADILVPPGSRAVIIAPHPGDEVLGCGGLLCQLTLLERSVALISVTDGGGSHPGSLLWPEQRLTLVRPRESADALHRLGLDPASLIWSRAGYADGDVAAQEDALVAFLQQHLHVTDVVFATWSEDGHPDHEAVGRAAGRACVLAGAQLLEIPIRAWHWAHPEDERLPWERARKVLLDPATQARKRDAALAFSSQLQGDPSIGLAPNLPAGVLERLLQPFELVFG
jgi:LmbE family N-acetylglucosaminyl deacetylase